MYAARFRNEVLLLILSAALLRVGGDPARLPQHVAALMVSASGRSRETLLSVINYCVDRLSTSEDANLRALAPGLQQFAALDSWFGAADAGPFVSHPTIAETGRARRAPVELVLGSMLRSAVSDAQLAVWSETLRERLGVPLTNLAVVDGDVEPDEAELRFHGRRVSRCAFRPDRLRVSKRLWELSGGGRSDDVFQAAEGGEDVLWLAPEVVSEANYRFASLGFEETLLQWLESRCRSSFDLLFDVGLQLTFIREVVGTPDGRIRLQRIGRHLRSVLVSLVEEGVPLGSREDLLEQMADLAQRVEQPDQLVQRIREHLRAGICRSVTDAAGQVTTVLLADHLEQKLGDRVSGGRLDVTPDEAIRLDEAIRRLVIRNAETVAGAPLVVVTIPRLRHALARLLHQFDHQLPVLSFTELEEDLIAVPGGLVELVLEQETERDRTQHRI
jgi:type III secretory pathway component EscV